MSGEVKEWNTDKNIPHPCEFCTGDTSVYSPALGRNLTSAELCLNAGTCVATIDWDEVYHARRG
jgi:hypothetical protein